MTISDTASIVTAIVAVVALLLSIYNFYVDRRDKGTQLKVGISNGFLTYGPRLSDCMLFLEIANVGQSRAVINSAKLKWRKDGLVFPWGIDGTRELPFELLPGDGARLWTPMNEVLAALREHGIAGSTTIQACFTDVAGNEYSSQKWRLTT